MTQTLLNTKRLSSPLFELLCFTTVLLLKEPTVLGTYLDLNTKYYSHSVDIRLLQFIMYVLCLERNIDLDLP